LFAWIHPAIIRYCRARIGRTGVAYSSADDVAQEVWLAVCAALSRFNDETQSFLPFVYGIAAHKVADHYRRTGRDKTESTADVPDMVDLESTPEQRAMRADGRARLWQLLHILTARLREILALRLMAVCRCRKPRSRPA
jgi:RNA polymerase sigma-70 factor (ECF subfamily)